MSTDVTTSQSFQDRMFERIRSQIGELMTDEELKLIVEAAMQKAFFEEVKDGYGRVQAPAPVVKLIGDLLREQVTVRVKVWVQDHPDEITQTLNDCIAKGIVSIVIEYFDGRIRWPLQQLADQLRSKGVL